jgi:DNA-binding NtrC family response regulator
MSSEIEMADQDFAAMEEVEQWRAPNFTNGKNHPTHLLVCLPDDSKDSGSRILAGVRKHFADVPCMVAINGERCEGVRQLLDEGALDFVTPPFRTVELVPRLRRLNECNRNEDTTARIFKKDLGLQQFIGDSPTLLLELAKIPKVAKCDVTVLIEGETGTGKEICARAIHDLSLRSGGPFIAVNCGAIPAELVENELFGHETGAFTGAVSSAAGLILQADGGTLFLDEVDSLPQSAQVKLLRFLQDKHIRPLGSRKLQAVNIRTVAASNTRLEESVKSARFRQDLFYRLNVIRLRMPPLRDRKCDIPILARHFLRRYSIEFARPATDFSLAAINKLLLYDWKGNVRELENTIQRCVVLSDQRTIRPQDIDMTGPDESLNSASFRESKAKAVATFEKEYLQSCLMHNGGNISRAASEAKQDRRAFWRLMKKHQIRVPIAVPSRTAA